MCKKPENVVDVIQLLKEQLPPQQDEGSLLFIDIRRDFVLQDALREGWKAKFTTNKLLRVSVLYPIYYVFFLGQILWLSNILYIHFCTRFILSEKVLSTQVGRGENFSDYWLKEPATAPTSMVARLEVFSHATSQDTRLTL